ncbi:asparaginase [Nonomuraea sp. K274]|uniref:Asparaginase n=1 Tax=Nonomuraea cypriaca TaxID=1187855 RepID=A0A931A3W1_9ACTN|nr:asparaginase [Nonomuraea cypriaca]MBF8185772.1 asparaginase [Nonomuraea cypriaca]
MSRPLVALASLGGTITMTGSGTGGVSPSLTAADLVSAVPGLADAADLRATTLATSPGASLGTADMRRCLAWAAESVRAGAAGVVVVQGTDTIEETAYFLDLHWDHDEPLVVTGAMRTPQAAGPDGPANLYAAVITAAEPASRGLGALVVMNDTVHAARRVRKCHTSAPQAFVSPGFGVLGHVVEGRVRYGNAVARHPVLPLPQEGPHPRVAMVETCFDDDGGLLAYAAAQHDGIVLAGFGVGHVPAALAGTVSAATARVPVVLASRTGAGSTARETYGFAGSERDLIARGAIPAGFLDARKSRILLGSLLALGVPHERILAEFGARGAWAQGPTVADSGGSESV